MACLNDNGLDLRDPRIRPEGPRFADASVLLRRRGIEFPDPDPVRRFDMGSMRGPDGGLASDPFSPAFLAASEICVAEADLTLPGAPPAS